MKFFENRARGVGSVIVVSGVRLDYAFLVYLRELELLRFWL